MTKWQKERLTEQLKFFGAKKTKFISVYAKKPRIVCRAKVKQVSSNRFIRESIGFDNKEIQLAALYNQQRQMGIHNSSLGYSQMAAMNHAHTTINNANMCASNAAMSQASHGLGGACGVGALIGMGGYGVNRQ